MKRKALLLSLVFLLLTTTSVKAEIIYQRHGTWTGGIAGNIPLVVQPLYKPQITNSNVTSWIWGFAYPTYNITYGVLIYRWNGTGWYVKEVLTSTFAEMNVSNQTHNTGFPSQYNNYNLTLTTPFYFYPIAQNEDYGLFFNCSLASCSYNMNTTTQGNELYLLLGTPTANYTDTALSGIANIIPDSTLYGTAVGSFYRNTSFTEENQTDWHNSGETATCELTPYLLPSNATSITTSLFTEIDWSSSASCVGSFSIIKCNPYSDCDTETNSNHCNETSQTFYYATNKNWNAYVGGDTVLAKSTVSMSGCGCRGQWKARCRLFINYQIPCTEGWFCYSAYQKAYGYSDCSYINLTYCPNGCAIGNCTEALPVIPPSQPLINQTQLAEAGAGWMAPFFTPLFFSIILIIGISGFVTAMSVKWGGEAAGQQAGVIFLGTASLLVLIFSVLGAIPTWITIVYILVAGYIFAKFIGVIK